MSARLWLSDASAKTTTAVLVTGSDDVQLQRWSLGQTTFSCTLVVADRTTVCDWVSVGFKNCSKCRKYFLHWTALCHLQPCRQKDCVEQSQFWSQTSIVSALKANETFLISWILFWVRMLAAGVFLLFYFPSLPSLPYNFAFVFWRQWCTRLHPNNPYGIWIKHWFRSRSKRPDVLASVWDKRESK